MSTPDTTVRSVRDYAADVEDKPREQHEFGVKDRFGRAIGASVSYVIATFRPWTSTNHSRSPREPGTYYEVRVQATRDGKAYGAGFNGAMFETAEDRDAYVAKYLKEARKRALKREGK